MLSSHGYEGGPRRDAVEGIRTRGRAWKRGSESPRGQLKGGEGGGRAPSGSSGSRVDEGFVNNRAAIRRPGETRTHVGSGQGARYHFFPSSSGFLFIIVLTSSSTNTPRRHPLPSFSFFCSRSFSASFSPPPPTPSPAPSPPQPPLFYLYHRNEVEEGTSWTCTFPVELREATFTR